MEDQTFSWNEQEGQLAVDVQETPSSIIIQSAIAGSDANTIDIQISSDVVTIRGERKNTQEFTNATIHFQECFWGSFSRSIVLPHQINPNEADATFKNSILTLTLPKTIQETQVKVRNLD